mmetsp:Transcript_115657/g.360240  ORF Transcript_115657/g.360240 Transcript_115657/m.360240 type:complete len:470 (-) Transcript_115657:1-1410(-)
MREEDTKEMERTSTGEMTETNDYEPEASVQNADQEHDPLLSDISGGTASVSCSTSAYHSQDRGDSLTPSIDERMQRWQARRLAKKQRKCGYGALARAVVESNNADTDITTMIKEKGLPISLYSLLGSGSFARVYKGTWVHNGEEGVALELEKSPAVAVKCIRKRRSAVMNGGHAGEIPRWLQREIQTSLALRHVNLVQLFQASIERYPFIMVMEFCDGGTLYELLHNDRGEQLGPWLDRLSWRQRLKLAADVATGMEHMHAMGVMHRDLKTQNVMLAQPVRSTEDEPLAKVCDFGLAREFGNEMEVLSRQVGSWQYMAPEVFEDKDSYTEMVDVYSFSMVMFELITDEIPFSHLSSHGRACLGLLVAQGERPKVGIHFQERIPCCLRGVMEQCWRDCPSLRPCFRSTCTVLQSELQLQARPPSKVACRKDEEEANAEEDALPRASVHRKERGAARSFLSRLRVALPCLG